ncbi:thioesterase II family protein [Actinomadura sp. WMMB 499]|uniref:thioesterase II family protein n=1 Tax=Actinomadura sp. WMMB 499 TaxID=1219491 RepID=UPI0012489307|nr:alpha/beta fold hydrolase [Actinomadura sp. WMMB 499]QFG24785.1 thioesterase [Actinomadura sp. WMMB 499]
MDGLTTTHGPATGPAAPERSWTVRWNRPPSPRLRLFCLPHAGGGAGAYRAWTRYLPPDVEVVAIRLPGRETAFRETPLTSVDDVVRAVVRQAAPLLDRPHAWFGHSMGAILAFEACRALRRLGLGEPARLLVSGRDAPHLPYRRPPVHAAPLPDLLARLHDLGGTPRDLLDDPSALSPLLPSLRADFAVVEGYRHRPGPPLDCPISVFAGTGDLDTTRDGLAAWRSHSGAGCVVRMFDGGHFYLHDDAEGVVPGIGRDLPGPPGADDPSGRTS